MELFLILSGVTFFVVLILVLLRVNWKHTELTLSIGKVGFSLIDKLADVLDKDPEHESGLEKALKYVNMAVVSLEQTYKKTKADLLEVDRVAFNEELKREAVALAEELCEADGYEFTRREKDLLGILVEYAVFFLPPTTTKKPDEVHATDSKEGDVKLGG